MAVLVRGQVKDRPWGQTLGALGLRQLTGQITLHAEDKDYAIAFDLGRVVGGWSPNAQDSAPRVALTNHLLVSSQVAAIARRITALPDRDEVDIVAEMARLSPAQVELLRSRLVAQRAARTFSVDAAEFIVDDEITIPIIPGPGIDIRSVVYLGARLNLAEQRLGGALRAFGAYFQLKPEAADTLDRYGFGDAERTVLVELTAGTSLHELEAAHRELDPRMVQAIVYALFSCGACEISDAPAMPRAATVRKVQTGAAAPEPVSFGPSVARTATQDPQPAADPDTSSLELGDNLGATPFAGLPSDMDLPPAVGRVPTENPFPIRTPTPPVTGRTPGGEFPMRTPTPGRAGSEFPMRTPTPPISGRASTENPFPLRSPTPPISGRASTENPFPLRSPTPPVESRTASSNVRAVNGPDEQGVPRSRSGTVPPRTQGVPDPSDPPTVRTPAPRPGGAPASPRAGTANPAPRAPTANPTVARTATGNPAVARTGTGPAIARTGTGPAIARTTTARKTQALIAARAILLEQGADHFGLLGVTFDAPVDTVRTAYLNLVRQLHPDKLAELAIDDSQGTAHRLFAAMGNAFAVLTDPDRRAAYIASLQNDVPQLPRTKTSDEVATTPAHEAFRRGEAALRRDEPHEAIAHFQRAVELTPNDLDYLAMLGWAQFCASRDKEKAAVETRKALDRAIQRSQKRHVARFLLGRVERMLGRDKEALRHFQIVLEDQPSHAEARSEIRAIEARLASGAGKKR
ncbi:MAG: DnaJ domain-containing protein [Deltaproteobacteria bacterium]|nr:DnaJ domain-containing protein [Deltaproteobacteria bacterium]